MSERTQMTPGVVSQRPARVVDKKGLAVALTFLIAIAVWAGEREGPLGHHLQQLAGRGQVGQLQLARHARCGEVGVPGEHGDDAAVRADGHGLLPHRHAGPPLRLTVPHDPAVPPGAFHPVHQGVREERADNIERVRRQPGRRPHVRDGQPGAVRCTHPAQPGHSLQ